MRRDWYKTTTWPQWLFWGAVFLALNYTISTVQAHWEHPKGCEGGITTFYPDPRDEPCP